MKQQARQYLYLTVHKAGSTRDIGVGNPNEIRLPNPSDSFATSQQNSSSKRHKNNHFILEVGLKMKNYIILTTLPAIGSRELL